MSLYSQLDRLASDLDAVKKQLHAVANTNQLQRSSVEAGSLDFNDEDGNLKAIIGLQHDGATTVNVVNGPKPPTPAGLTAAVDNGRIILRWDGTFAGDLIAPTDWARTEIYAQEGSFVVPTPANARGSFVSAAGGELTIGVTRGTWTVCVASWSQAGRQSEMSVPITVEVPGFGDIVLEKIDAAQTKIENAKQILFEGTTTLEQKLADMGDMEGIEEDIAQAREEAIQAAMDAIENVKTELVTSINGKTTTTWSTSNPPTSYTGPVGDLWVKMSSLGSGGREIARSRWNGSVWVSATIDGAVLSNVDASTITTGFLDVANRIRAGSIFADKLLIGGDRNLIPNGDLSTGTAAGWHANAVYSATGGPNNARMVTFPAGGYAYYPFGSTRFPVTPGETLVFETWVKADTPDSVLFVTIQDQSGPSTSTSGRLTNWKETEGGANQSQGPVSGYTVPTTWTKKSARITVPEGVESVVFQSFYLNHSSGSNTSAAVSFSGMKLFKPVGGTLITPGGVQTPHLAADVLEVGNLKAGTAALAEAVIAKLWAEVVVAKMVTATEFIGENAILTGAITAPKITASEELTAKIAEFLKVRAEMIEADAIDGMVIRGLTLLAGNDRHRLDDGGYALFDENGDRRTYLSPGGSSFKGEVEADNLVVNGGAELRGTENTLAQGSKLTIAAGVTDPTAPPTVQPYWDGLKLSGALEDAIGLAWDGTSYWTVLKNRGSGHATIGKRIYAKKINPNTGEISNATIELPNVGFPAVSEIYGVTCIGSELFFLGRYGYRFHVYVIDSSGNYLRGFDFEDVGYSNTNPLTYKPGIGNDGTNVVIGHASDDGTLRVRTYNKTTGAQIGSTASEGNANFKGDISGVYIGAADDSTTRVYINKVDAPNVYAYTTSAVYDIARTFTGASSGATGVVFAAGKFRTLDPSGIIHEYANSNTGDGLGDWWATYYWYTDIDDDDIIEASDYRSRMAPPKRFTWPRRAMLKILGQPLPSGVEALGPALAKKSTTPTRTDFSGPGWQVDSGKPSARYKELPTNWTAYASPSADNTYPTAVPASIESSSSTLQFKGDGSGRWGPLKVDTAGKLTGAVCAGEVTVTPTGSSGTRTGSAAVTFPSGRFTTPPTVVANASTSVPGTTVVGASASNVTATGFTAYLARVNNTATPIAWIATEGH